MSFTLELKSGEKYKFHKIKTVKIEEKEEGELFTINGNFKNEKGNPGKYKEICLWKKIIRNIKSFEKWLGMTMKFYECEGKCPKCGSEYLTRYDSQIWGLKLNDYERKTSLLESELVHIYCNVCDHTFNEEEMKENNTVIFFK